MPKATETLSDSFLPRIGIWIILSDLLRMLFGKPLTSSPRIKATDFLTDFKSFKETAPFACSKETISAPSFLSLFITRQVSLRFSQATKFSAPKETFSMFGLGGAGVIPHKNILETPAASAVLKIEPTLCRLRILWQMTYVLGITFF